MTTLADSKIAKTAIEGKDEQLGHEIALWLAKELTALLKPADSIASQRAQKIFEVWLFDTIEFILKSVRSKGRVDPQAVILYMSKKHKNLFQAAGLDHAACAAAVAQLMITLSAAVPMMAMEFKALLVTSGMAWSGVGIPFAVGSATLLVLSGLGVYFSATQTADVCSMTLSALADRHGASVVRSASYTANRPALRCEIPVQQFNQHVFHMLNLSLKGR